MTDTPTQVSLEGRVAMITGAARNIGQAIATELAAEGADGVLLVHSNGEESEAVAEEVYFSGLARAGRGDGHARRAGGRSRGRRSGRLWTQSPC